MNLIIASSILFQKCSKINARFFHNGYYDVLGVKPSCSQEEIRAAFVKLSKKLHPDAKGLVEDPKNAAQFIKVVEAYQVLSKKEKRASYDVELHSTRTFGCTSTNARDEFGTTITTNRSNTGPYYGINGIRKVSNLKIAAILILVASIGTLFQFLTVRNSVTFRRERLDDVSKEATLKHALVRANAEKYGNEKQLERLSDRVLNNQR